MKDDEHKKRELLDEETEEDIKEDFEEGDKEADVYTEEGLDYLNEEDDSLDIDEQGFMEGEIKASETNEDETESPGTCDHCGKLLGMEFTEQDIAGEHHRFCCDTCASEFEKVEEEEAIAEHSRDLKEEEEIKESLEE